MNRVQRCLAEFREMTSSFDESGRADAEFSFCCGLLAAAKALQPNGEFHNDAAWEFVAAKDRIFMIHDDGQITLGSEGRKQ